MEINERDIVRGVYLEVVPFSRLVFTWGWEGEKSPLPPGSSTVEISLTPEGEGTRLVLYHKGLPPPLKAIHAEGWDHFLPRLQISAEGREDVQDSWSM